MGELMRRRRTRVPACEAKRLLKARGIDFRKDFHQLARMFYSYLQRKRSC